MFLGGNANVSESRRRLAVGRRSRGGSSISAAAAAIPTELFGKVPETHPGGCVKKIRAEYVWIDGQKPTAKLRSKTKFVDGPVKKIEELPDWGFDGSSTSQAEGHFSDCQLKPVRIIPDPLHDEQDVLVLCEVLNADGSVHGSNTRARLRTLADKHASHEVWFGIEQE